MSHERVRNLNRLQQLLAEDARFALTGKGDSGTVHLSAAALCDRPLRDVILAIQQRRLTTLPAA